MRRTLTTDEADRLAQERPPYPAPSVDPVERCDGPTRWHCPQVEDWNNGERESTCRWCSLSIRRRFADPIWRALTYDEDRVRMAAIREEYGDGPPEFVWVKGWRYVFDPATPRLPDERTTA